MLQRHVLLLCIFLALFFFYFLFFWQNSKGQPLRRLPPHITTGGGFFLKPIELSHRVFGIRSLAEPLMTGDFFFWGRYLKMEEFFLT